MKQKIAIGLEAAWHSTYITATAITGGLLAAAVASGNAGSESQLLAYVKANAFGYIIANVIAPALRAAAAVQKGS